MPIEIRELVIRASITGERHSPDEADAGLRPDRSMSQGPPGRELTEAEIDHIVDACVKQVLRVMRKSDER